MDQQINILNKLVDQLIQRNLLLREKNKELNDKINKLEELAVRGDKYTELQENLGNSESLKSKLEALESEVTECINITQKLIELQ